LGVGNPIPEPAGARARLRIGRWVYEKGEAGKQAGRGGQNRKGSQPGRLAAAGLQGTKERSPARSGLALGVRICPPWWLRARGPIFSKSHTNEFCGAGKSTPKPAGPCAPLRIGRRVYEGKGKQLPRGGCWGSLILGALAPLRGSLRGPPLVPFHTSPSSRGALRSAGVPTIAASTTSAPLLPPGATWSRLVFLSARGI